MTSQTPIFPHAAERERNGFDLIRLLLACTVLYSHLWLLGGFGEEPFFAWNKNQMIAGEIGVLGFFGLSGFLVANSLERSRGPFDFLLRRARRILPGLWVCLLVTAFVMAPLCWQLRHGDMGSFPWGREQGALGYAFSNAGLVVRQWNIDGLLAGAPYEGSWNGSLWSLAPEAVCYMGLAAVGWAGTPSRTPALLVFATVLAVFFHAIRVLLPEIGTPLLPAPAALTSLTPYPSAFLCGACMAAFRERIPRDIRTGLVLLGIAGVLLKLGGFTLVAPVLVTACVVQIGLTFALPLRHDLSYGLYIYGFPVQQTLASLAWPRTHWIVFLLASLVFTAALAGLSWFLVERPWLARRLPPASPTTPR